MINARAKSLYIVPATAIATLTFLVSAFLAIRGGTAQLAWVGAALAAVPLPLTVAWVFLSRQPRLSESAPLALLLSSAGVLLSGWECFIEQQAPWQIFAVAVFGLALLVLYVYWYARFGRIDSAWLSVGGTLPEFSIQDIDGNTVTSADLRGQPAVVLFYRGNWCPLCVAQVHEIAARWQDFDKLGIRVYLVSPQSEARSRTLAAELDVPFRFLVDTDNALATQLDIAIANGVPAGLPGAYQADTVMPTVVVTNANGTIVYADQTDNYRVRPEPDIFLAILRRTGALAQ